MDGADLVAERGRPGLTGPVPDEVVKHAHGVLADEHERVQRLILDVHAEHVEPGVVVALGRAALLAEQVEQQGPSHGVHPSLLRRAGVSAFRACVSTMWHPMQAAVVTGCRSRPPARQLITTPSGTGRRRSRLGARLDSGTCNW